VIWVFLVTVAGTCAQTSRTLSGIYGMLRDEADKPAAGILVNVVWVAGAMPKGFQPLSTLSDANGLFSFPGLQAGLYRVCPGPLNGLLNPCEWFDNPPSALLGAGPLSRAELRIVLVRGRLLNIRVEDPEAKLQVSAKGVADHVVSVSVRSPKGIHMAPQALADAGGVSHMLVVPAGVSLGVDVTSPTLNVVAQGEAATLQAATGKVQVAGQATPLPLEISSSDTNKQLRYTVHAKGN